jgi:DNA-binding GntR family transcriptional regulator
VSDAQGNDRAPYERIVEHFRAQIEAGELRPGDRLPTVREIAETWSVARQTANKAISTLSHAGLVSTAGRGGTVVLDRSPEASVTVAIDRPGRVAVAGTEVSAASAAVAEQLGVEPGSTIIVVRLKATPAEEDT